MSDRHRLVGAVRVVAAVAVAVVAVAALAGCGPPPPQAPVGIASKVSGALTTIAAQCGEAYRARAFHPRADLGPFDRAAAASARVLLGDARRHPRWIYQGMTLAQERAQARARLTECGLGSAAGILRGGG